MAEYVIFLLSGLAAGLLVSWFFMRQRSTTGAANVAQQTERFERDINGLRVTIEVKEKEILRLTALVSEKEENLRNLRGKA